MWEIDLHANELSKSILDAIDNDKYFRTKTIKVTNQIKNHYILSIADTKTNYATNKANYIICKHIIEFYKKRYFLTNINGLNKIEECIYQGLITALVDFDIDNEIGEIISFVTTSKYINIDSLYMFMMKEIRNNWQELLQIVNDSIINHCKKESLLDIIKFLVISNQNEHKLINIHYDGQSFVIFDDKDKVVDKYIYKESVLFTKLIKLAPIDINLHCSTMLTTSMFKTLYYIFDKRINLKA